MRWHLVTAALTFGLAIGCGSNPTPNPQGGGDKPPDPKQLAELESARGAVQDFADAAVAAKWGDARGALTRGFNDRLVGVLKDPLWVEEALAKLVYFRESRVGDGFVREKPVPAEKKFDKAVIATQTLLVGDEALFAGNLSGGKRQARFLSRAVKDGGKWKVDSFLVVDDGKQLGPSSARWGSEQESAQAIADEFLELCIAGQWVQARNLCGKDYLKKLMGIFDDPMWADEALAKQTYFPEMKPGDGFAHNKPIPAEKQLDGVAVKPARVNGDEATVEGDLTGPRRKAEFKLKAVKEGGKWRVNGLTLTDK
jgi:hypothetical protein